MSTGRQHKWIAEWLRSVYEDLLDGRYGPKSQTQFFIDYNRVCSWQKQSPPKVEQIKDEQEWIEYVSDCFHIHQSKRGTVLREWDFLPHVTKGDIDTQSPWKPKIQFKVAVDNLRSAFNVGSIFRLVDAIGFESIIVGGRSPGIEHRNVIKTAMGSTDWIPQKKVDDLTDELNQQKEEGYRIIGIETIRNSKTYLEFQWPEKGIIVLGNEEYGLSKRVMSCCDEFIHLPMMGRKNSINVAAAMAVVAFHIAALCTNQSGG